MQQLFFVQHDQLIFRGVFWLRFGKVIRHEYNKQKIINNNTVADINYIIIML